MLIQVLVPRWGSVAGGPGQESVLPGEVGGLNGVQSNNYWSATANADDPSNAWNVNLNNGNVNNDNKTNTNYVWPVRDGE